MRILSAFLALLLVCLAAGYFYTRFKAREISARFPPEGRFAEIDGGRIHYTDLKPAGAAKGVVALVHGASGNEREMRAALGAMLVARGYRVIALDRPGHGWSARFDAAGDASPAQQALLLRRALEKIGVVRPVVVGHSLAGALSLQLALDHADYVSGIVLVGAVSHPWPGGIALYYSISALSFAGPLFNSTLTLPLGLAMFDPTLEKVFKPEKVAAQYRARSGVELVLRPDAFHYNALDVAALHGFVSQAQARYRDIRLPVGIIAGDGDTIVSTPIHARVSAAMIAGAKLTILNGAGHAPHWTRPDKVVDAIEDVVSRAHSAAGRVPSAR